jgi:hypothetical protein
MLTALDLEFALTTAWARLNRLLGGCSGIVKRNSSTAKASTSGALFVTMVVALMTSSSSSRGSLSEASNSSGLMEL